MLDKYVPRSEDVEYKSPSKNSLSANAEQVAEGDDCCEVHDNNLRPEFANRPTIVNWAELETSCVADIHCIDPIILVAFDRIHYRPPKAMAAERYS